MTNTKWIPRARVYSEHDLFLSQARAVVVSVFFGAMLLVVPFANRSSGEEATPVALGELSDFSAVSEHTLSQEYSAYVDSHFADLAGTGWSSKHRHPSVQVLSPVRLNEVGDEVRVEEAPLSLPPEPFSSIPAKPKPSYYCECLDWLSEVACDKNRKIVAYHFVRLTLDELEVPQHPNACGFMAAWYRLEAGKEFKWAERNHNPLGMKPGGDTAAYASAEEGAAVLADQLDGTLRLGEGERDSKHQYPAITRILRDAQNYPTKACAQGGYGALECMLRDNGVIADLTKWCSCDHNRKTPYAKQLAYNIRAKLF